jgi:hypothetical protein
MTRTNRQRDTGRRAHLALALLAATVALLALGASTAPAANDRATGTCWKDVVNDWLQHQPNVAGSYPIPCYTQAIQHLDSYPDIQQYSSAPDDIHRALLAAIRNNRGDGGNSGGSSVGPSSSSGGGTPSSSRKPSGGTPTAGGSSPSTTPATDKSFVTRLFDAVGPGNAQSIPLPLLVLAGLALLLLLAAAGTWLMKRVQSRRMTPAPAPARRN